MITWALYYPALGIDLGDVGASGITLGVEIPENHAIVSLHQANLSMKANKAKQPD